MLRQTFSTIATLVVSLCLTLVPAHAQTFTVLHTFVGGSDGYAPFDGLILDPQGNLYGTTALGGGAGCADSGGCGTVFKVDPAGNTTILYAFTGLNGDGQFPYGGLVRDSAGNLYGTTNGGGVFTKGKCNSNSGCGTIFKVSASGQESVLHAFNGMGDGGIPYQGLTRDRSGNLYGTTYIGGLYNWGVLYKFDLQGNLRPLHNFNGKIGDGGDVMGVPFRDAAGNLYGTTQGGGTAVGTQCEFIGCGVIYKVTPTGGESLLYTFTASSEGSNPESNLIQDAAGNFYGTSQGPFNNGGTVFKIDTSGNFSVIYTFLGDENGGDTVAGLVLDSAGNLYGTTFTGGIGSCAIGGCGTVFKLTQSGMLTVLYRFTGLNDGGNPLGGLVRDAKGNLYGTALNGGADNCGVVFKVTP